MTEITFEIQEEFSVDVAKRTIRGLAVPYGVASSVKNGRKFRFSKGFAKFSDLSRIKILVDHDNSQAVGRVIHLDDTDGGLWVTFSIKMGPRGDEVLHEAAQQVKDGLSIGIFDPVEFTEANDGVLDVSSALLREITITAMPSFDDARMTLVNFSLDTKEKEEMPEIVEKTEAPVLDFSGLTAAISEGFSTAFEKFNEKPEVVGNAPLFVAEAAPYRFDRSGSLRPGGEHSFSVDLISGLKAMSGLASNEFIPGYERALKFMQEQFADVDSTDGAALNPSGQRPDLYVDQRSFQYPLVTATLAGSLTDKTPFVIPKFSSASGLVATHVEGVEPANGAFAATSQTVTPTGVGGKVEITRELWDQGGNPKIDGLIWKQMVKGWYEALEARVVAALDAVSPTGITITTAVVDDVLSGELGAAIAGLQYVRGGFAFDTFAIQIDLYKALADAVDGNKRPLFPIYNPQNANGQSAPRYGNMNVHGVNGFPEWALAAEGTVAASSYLFDHESVNLWASTPERIDWNFGSTVQDSTNISQLSHVTLGIWGYAVAAVTDLTGVREVIYDDAA